MTEHTTTMEAARLDRAAAESLLFEEARLLDERDWESWLALYDEEATFWVPTWRDIETLSSDPLSELSFIYYDRRKGLEERVWRLNSGLSPASAPLPRTQHAITNIQVDPDSGRVRSNVMVNLFNPRQARTHVNFGVYHHELVATPGGWKIAAKKVVLLNDYLPMPLDIYAI